MKYQRNILLFAISLWGVNAYCAPDGFDKVKCGSEVPKALTGQLMKNETVAAIENRHKDLGLQHMGADELAVNFNAVYWMICGKRYVVLMDGDRVRDAMQLSEPSDGASEYTGRCKVNNKEMLEMVFAILDKKTVKDAWEMNRKTGFVKLSTKGIQCQ